MARVLRDSRHCFSITVSRRASSDFVVSDGSLLYSFLYSPQNHYTVHDTVSSAFWDQQASDPSSREHTPGDAEEDSAVSGAARLPEQEAPPKAEARFLS